MDNPKRIKYCDFCETKDATCICFKCNNYFCDECYKIIHSLKEEQKEEHKKENIDIFVPIELKCQKHPKYLNSLFCINEKMICCLMCHYKNLHEGHKLVEISNEEILKKENFNVKYEKDNFNEISKKMEELKNKIEAEINKINQAFDKTISELKNAYQKKHEILLKEEKNLQEKLENTVTKTKEQLELYLSEINEDIRISNRIDKGFNKLIGDKQSLFQILSYVSKINTSQKSMIKLRKEFMKTIKFNYEEEKNIINYEEIIFNGMIIPENIQFKEIKKTNFKIYWNTGEANFENVDLNLIKYKVEIRKKNEEMFKEVYEGEKTNCLVYNLELNTTYEVRICSIFKDIIGDWSEIKEVTTLIDSSILIGSNRCQEFLEKIYEWTGAKKMELLFRSSRDGMSADVFHNRCNNQGPTIVFIQNGKGHIFGGYTSISWTSSNSLSSSNKNDPKAFLFTLTNIYNTPPTKFPSKNEGKEVSHYYTFGPIFGKDGADLNIQPNFNFGCCTFPHSFQDVLEKGNSIFSSEDGNPNFEVKDVEVFKLL